MRLYVLEVLYAFAFYTLNEFFGFVERNFTKLL